MFCFSRRPAANVERGERCVGNRSILLAWPSQLRGHLERGERVQRLGEGKTVRELFSQVLVNSPGVLVVPTMPYSGRELVERIRQPLSTVIGIDGSEACAKLLELGSRISPAAFAGSDLLCGPIREHAAIRQEPKRPRCPSS